MSREQELLDAIEFYKAEIRVYKRKDLQQLAYFKIPNNTGKIEIYEEKLNNAELQLKELIKWKN